MRHGDTNRRFGRDSAHRRSLFRNMATSLLLHEKFRTTVQKAKDLKKIVEPLITLGRKDTLHARRQAYSYLMDKAVVHKLFAEISPRFKNREGGYLRVLKADRRHGDAAEMAYIELVVGPAEKKAVSEEGAKADKKPKAKKAAAKSKE